MPPPTPTPGNQVWRGSVYWPLAPFNLLLNELVLTRPVADFWQVSDIDRDGLTGAKRDLQGYWKFFLLQPTESGGSRFRSWPRPVGSWALPAQTNTFGKTEEDLKQWISAATDTTLASNWLGWLGSIPQHKNVPNLVYNSSLTSLQNDVFFEAVIAQQYEWFSQTTFFGNFYAWAELACAEDLVSAASHFPEVREFSQSHAISPHLLQNTLPLKDLRCLLVKSSFFADGAADVLFYVFLQDLPSDPIKLDTLPTRLAAGLQGAAYTVRGRRRQWLQDWIQHLKRTVCEHLAKAGNKHALRFASQAIAYMTLVLMKHSGRANGQITEQILTGIKSRMEGKPPYDADLEILQDALVANRPSTIPIALRSPRALDVLHTFLRPACDGVAQALRGMEQGELKGTLAIDTKLALRQRANNSPVSARLLLQGAPGGGKGAAAKEFHAYWMERVCKAIDLPTIEEGEKPSEKKLATEKRTKALNDALGDDAFSAWTDREFKAYIKDVKDVLWDIFSLPMFAADQPSSQWRTLFQRQLEGTRWWSWNDRDQGDDCVFARFFVNGCIEPDASPAAKGVQRFLQDIADIPLPVLPIDPSRPQNGQIRFVAYTKKLVAGYLSRFIRHLFKVKTFPERDRKWSFNFVQITCGTLGTEGVELRASLRQLFGEARFGGSEHSVPGVFQISSYMGGTLFLDEIADLPIKLQDNLLMPLEERKVFRCGWETSKEDVSNVRIVAATFKDLRSAAKLFTETVKTGSPQGFRPDLLTRLAGTPPVSIPPISDYFLYSSEGSLAARELYRREFVSILRDKSIEKNASAPRGLADFWQAVYDVVDRQITAVVESQHHFAVGLSDFEKRKDVASHLSMRLFMFMADTLKETIKKNENRLDERMSYLRADYLPQMLTYLLNG